MQTQHLSPTPSLQGAAGLQDGADNINMMLSALADGELSEREFEQLMQHWDAHEAQTGLSAQVYQVWEQYHVVGQSMRVPELHPAANNSMAFLYAFRERLAVEQMQSTPQSNVNEFLQPAPAVSHVAADGKAANHSVFRWKMVAGFASLAAVAAIGWNTVADFSGRSQGQAMQLASNAEVPAVVTASAQGTNSAAVALQDVQPSRSVMAVANRAATPTFSRDTDGVTGIVIRDPKLDEILNRQYGSSVAMQGPGPFVRNASVNGVIGH